MSELTGKERDCTCERMSGGGTLSVSASCPIHGDGIYRSFVPNLPDATIEQLQQQIATLDRMLADERSENDDLQQQIADLTHERDEWKDAIIDACVVDWILEKEHYSNPRKAVNDLLAWQMKIALDPAVSKEAHDLHERLAVLEAREVALREEFDRLFQAVEGYRCGSLSREGMMHYYDVARQFIKIAHPSSPADKEQP